MTTPRPPKSTFQRAVNVNRLKLPTSGSEAIFTDQVYGTPTGKRNNNCYAWALDEYRNSGGIKLQPGNLSQQSSDLSSTSCAFLKDRVMDDNKARGIKAVGPAARCPKGFYKIMAFIAKGRDYHWYKQHQDIVYRVKKGDTLRSVSQEFGVPMSNITSPTKRPRAGDLAYIRNARVFSHKQGFATGPLLRDASGRVIPDPRAANRNYGFYDYKRFCGAMCVRNKSPHPAPSPRETKRLRSLLDKRLSLIRAKGKQPDNLRVRRPEM